MKLRDLMTVVFVDLVIYDGEQSELHRGSYKDVPESLLDREVVVVLAGRTGMLEVVIK